MASTVVAVRRKARPEPGRRPRRPQLEKETPLIAIAAARQVVEEATLWFGLPLPARYAAGLAFKAQRCYAQSPSFREKMRRPGDESRDLLYVFLRHWLAARLHTDRFDLYVRLPRGFATGEPPKVKDRRESDLNVASRRVLSRRRPMLREELPSDVAVWA